MRVLFIGNSFTARNDLPRTIAQLAGSRGHALEWQLVSAGGASLRAHWNKGVAIDAIHGGRWDWVVLQEQSTLPVKNPKRMHENVRLFDGIIRASGARTALYLTWARANAPAAQAAITEAYEAIGAELGATVVPVGRAWAAFMRAHPAPALHDRDLSHPSPVGSYLAACVFVAVLFGENPVSLPCDVAGLAPTDVAALQRAALEQVQLV